MIQMIFGGLLAAIGLGILWGDISTGAYDLVSVVGAVCLFGGLYCVIGRLREPKPMPQQRP